MRFHTQFPEELFPLTNSSTYINRVLLGEKIASRSKVLLAGICRNVEKVLPLTLLRIEHICSLFKHSHVFIYENDSTDNTRHILRAWDYPKTLVTENIQKEWHNTGTGQDRLDAMCAARNKYSSFSQKYDYDYLIVVDMDLLGGFSYNGILNTLGFMPPNSAVGSNGILFRKGNEVERIFYDTFAYREIGDCKTSEEKNKIVLNKGEEPYEVASCFGGLAVYNTKLGSYKNWDCDHVTQHEYLRSLGCKIYVNPSMITLYSGTIYSNSEFVQVKYDSF